MEIYNLPDKYFKVMFIKMLGKYGRRMGKHRTSDLKDRTVKL